MKNLSILKNCNLLFLHDDNKITKNIVSLLGLFVKEVFLAKDNKKAFHILLKEKIDLIIVDSHLKNESGIDFIEKVRLRDQQIAIILISDHKNEEILFRVVSLKLSGYIVKPISYIDLIKAFERCTNQLELKTEKLIKLKTDFIYDRSLKQVIKENKIYELNKKEILFFEILCENKEKIISKETIKKYVYEQENLSSHILCNFILRIRKKFGKDFLYTIPNIGYKIIE